MRRDFLKLRISKQTQLCFRRILKASLRNLETQVRKMALSLQNQSRYAAFPSSIEINPKDLTPIALRSNDELQGNKKR